jgi:gluconolactonase
MASASPRRVAALCRRLRLDPRAIHVYEVAGGRVGPGRRFADMTPGSSDGIRCDTKGNLWAAAGGGGDGYDGVHVFAPDGALIGQVVLP